MNKFILCMILLTSYFIPSRSQDTLSMKHTELIAVDTIEGRNSKLTNTASLHNIIFNKRNKNPKTAVILSAILPGAGQLYNRQFYKVPIMYGAIGGVMYLFDTRISKYRDYQTAYKLRIANREDQFKGILSQTQLKQERDNSRKKLERTYLIAIGVYAYIIIDAYVSAHLSDFNVSDDLSLRIRPQENIHTGNLVGLGISARWLIE